MSDLHEPVTYDHPSDGPVFGEPVNGAVSDRVVSDRVVLYEPVLVNGVDLDSDPFADDLSAQLVAAAPKRWADRATLVLGALVLLVGGFLGGVQVEKHYGGAGSSAAASRRAAFTGGDFTRGGTGTAGAVPGATPSAGASGPATAASQTGTIKLVDGTTVYVSVTDDNVLTVRTDATTKVTVGTATKVSQLTAGEKVTVAGPTGSDGTITATAITAAP